MCGLLRKSQEDPGRAREPIACLQVANVDVVSHVWVGHTCLKNM
jgi:hypothetical protein